MKIVLVPAKRLKENPANPRGIMERQKSELKTSIKKFGLVEPIVVNKDFTIIGGHQRYRTAIELGLETIPCVVLDLNQKEADELGIRLNKNTGFFDFTLLESFSKDDLTEWGFESYEFGKEVDAEGFHDDTPEQSQEGGTPNAPRPADDEPISLKFIFESFEDKQIVITAIDLIRNEHNLTSGKALIHLINSMK